MTLLNRLALLLTLIVSSTVGAEDFTPEGFRIPQPNPVLKFPDAHGSHPEYRIEWWYLTGHLFEEKAKYSPRRFGVQATFFRLAQRPGANEEETFGNDQLYLAHMALTDVEGKQFLHEERLNREGWDADAKVGDLLLKNGNWSLRRLNGLGPGTAMSDSGSGSMALAGSILSDARFELQLTPSKPPVLFGENGLSKKGTEQSAASLYLTFTRLAAKGTLHLGNETIPVQGELWMDHEISSSQLGRDQVGWDWVSIQFFDGREMMAYILRKPDGTPDQFSSLSWIDEKGSVLRYSADAFEWCSEGEWKSDLTGDQYPIQPRVSAIDPATNERRSFHIRPVMSSQEMTGRLGGVSYWEGACDVIDEATDKVVGRAYLELTGYAGNDDLRKRLRGE